MRVISISKETKYKGVDSSKNELFQMAKMAKASRDKSYVHKGDPQRRHGPPAVGDVTFSHTSTIFISKAQLNKSPRINSWRYGLRKLSTETKLTSKQRNHWKIAHSSDVSINHTMLLFARFFSKPLNFLHCSKLLF